MLAHEPMIIVRRVKQIRGQGAEVGQNAVSLHQVEMGMIQRAADILQPFGEQPIGVRCFSMLLQPLDAWEINLPRWQPPSPS